MNARSAMSLLVAVLVVVVLTTGLFAVGQADPLDAYAAMFDGAFGSWQRFGETLIRFIPIALIALGIAPSLRVGLFNIGAPGQIAMGALLATLVSLYLAGMPTWLLLPCALIASAAGGMACAYLPAVLRARMNVNEILSTLVFNFLAILLLQYLLTGPLRGYQANLPQSDPLPAAAILPVIADGSRAHWGILLVILAAVILVMIERNRIGYRLRLFGANPRLAHQAGVSHVRTIVWTMCAGGALAGVAGWLQVAGVDHRLYDTVAGPIGYTGLFAALLGGLRPVGIVCASFLFAVILRGGEALQIGANVSPEIISALVGLILLVLAARTSPILKSVNRA